MAFQLSSAQKQVADSALPALLRELRPGPFGLTALSVESLEQLAIAADAGFEARRALETLILDQLKADQGGSGLSLPTLQPAHRSFLGAFQLVVMADVFVEWASTATEAPNVEGGLNLDGLEGLLAEDPEPLLSRLADITVGFVRQTAQKQAAAAASPEALVRTLSAGLTLLKNSVLKLAETGDLATLKKALAAHPVQFRGQSYRGLERVVELRNSADGLLPIDVSDIVGNVEYLSAAQRLARDVAGFDLDSKTNPKKLNPILFALGRPGCGKTVTAHAVGRYFLDYCKERNVPAKFLVIRRSDWASSYQNASASNLIRLFENEVKNFEGVCGIYWPDIDTALASRDSGKLRSEEKQNLGAVFGVFDGTILPKDGSWFMMCDANTMHMDEAAISRIAQNPMTVTGATTPEHYAQMMRDVSLKDVKEFLPTEESDWLSLGELAVKYDLSGRNVEAICGNVRAKIQDFEYPEEYFSASADERKQLVQKLSTKIDDAAFREEIEDFAKFQLESSRMEEEKAFEQDVENMVRQLNASKAAAASLTAD